MSEVIMWCGRFSTFTSGHSTLLDTLTAKMEELGCSGEVFVMDGKKARLDKRKNPLTGDERVALIRKYYPSLSVSKAEGSAYAVLNELKANSKNPKYWILGEDRQEKAIKLATDYGFETQPITVQRDGISATLARDYAFKNDFDGFLTTQPSFMDVEDSRIVFNLIRSRQEPDV